MNATNHESDARDRVEEEEEPVRSKSQAKREAMEVARVALELTKLSKKNLLELGLDEGLYEAILHCQALKKNARSRQLRRLAKLLRAVDLGPILRALQESSFRPASQRSARKRQRPGHARRPSDR